MRAIVLLLLLGTGCERPAAGPGMPPAPASPAASPSTAGPASMPPASTPPAGGPVERRAGWAASLTDLRGRHGLKVVVACPAGGPAGAAWGTDLYSDDSSVCTAGVHAGVIDVATGGTVTAVVRPGAAAYAGSRRHGVTTDDWGAWDGSFEVLR